MCWKIMKSLFNENIKHVIIYRWLAAEYLSKLNTSLAINKSPDLIWAILGNLKRKSNDCKLKKFKTKKIVNAFPVVNQLRVQYQCVCHHNNKCTAVKPLKPTNKNKKMQCLMACSIVYRWFEHLCNARLCRCAACIAATGWGCSDLHWPRVSPLEPALPTQQLWSSKWGQ